MSLTLGGIKIEQEWRKEIFTLSLGCIEQLLAKTIIETGGSFVKCFSNGTRTL